MGMLIWIVSHLCKTPWPWQNATPLQSWYIRVCNKKQSLISVCCLHTKNFNFFKKKFCLSLSKYLDDLGGDQSVVRAESFDVLLEIGVHVLENQIQNCLPFFVLALLQIQQSAN